ncbi:hypothetical protein ACSBR2_041885 [Camellia fascicularis]
MVKLCAGLPLAIIVLGGLLARKHTLWEWERVYRTVHSYISNVDRIQHSRVSIVLALSYRDLPHQLKPCFLYFGHFSENYEIDAERLYHLWIADGIIVDNDRVDDETIMDVAKRYLGALAQRFLVQVQVEEYTQKINYCRIHDLMLDLNYFPTTLTTTTPETHKLAIHLNRDVERVVLLGWETTKQLRSILFCNTSRDKESSIELNSHFKYFKLLRNLDLEGFKFDKKSVESIGNLISLRYLSCRSCFIPKWHSSICKLKYLQTLDLRGYNFNLGEEIVLHSMEGLRHLFISLNLNFKNKFKLDGLSNIVTFEGFNPWNYANILKQLLGCDHLYKLSIFGFIAELTEYQDFSCSIIKLQLCSCKLQEYPMPTLERLLCLQFLNLDFDAFVGDKTVSSANGFPQLKTLQLHCLMHFKESEVEREALPNLSVLAIHYYQGLEMVPEGLRFIDTLQQFTIEEMSETFNKLLGINGEEGEDFYKVQHVPSINIRRKDIGQWEVEEEKARS